MHTINLAASRVGGDGTLIGDLAFAAVGGALVWWAFVHHKRYQSKGGGGRGGPGGGKRKLPANTFSMVLGLLAGAIFMLSFLDFVGDWITSVPWLPLVLLIAAVGFAWYDGRDGSFDVVAIGMSVVIPVILSAGVRQAGDAGGAAVDYLKSEMEKVSVSIDTSERVLLP